MGTVADQALRATDTPFYACTAVHCAATEVDCARGCPAKRTETDPMDEQLPKQPVQTVKAAQSA